MSTAITRTIAQVQVTAHTDARAAAPTLSDVRFRIPVVALTAVLVLAGCSDESGDTSGDTAVLAAEDVFDGELDVVPDTSGTTATLAVTTSIDMACAVVYGTTEALGEGIATDTDMAGGAHADHEVLMTGLQPDTEYFFRVQGSGADGRLYRSELMTFRTPAADTEAPPGENAAVGAEIASVSSEFSDAFGAENAVDGDLATEWSSNGDGDDAWITVDLGEPVDVSGIGFHSRQMSDGTSIINSFTVTVDDGEPLGPFPAGPGLSVADVEFTGQVLRFDAVDTTGGNTGAVEIEVYQ